MTVHTLKNDIHATFKEFRRIIKINMYKKPEHYKGIYNDYVKSYYDNNSYIKYVDLLRSFGKFINKYDIDINQIRKSILDEIYKEYKINALKIIAFSEPEDNFYNKNDEENDREDEKNNEEEDEENNTHEEEKEVNKYEPNKLINNSISDRLLKNFNIVLEKAIVNNNKELMRDCIKSLSLLATIISLKNNDNTLIKPINTDNTLTKQINTDNNKQINTDNTLIKQINTDNTKQINIHNTKQTNNTEYTFVNKLRKAKLFINPLCTDEESFQYSIGLCKHKEIGVNYNRKNRIKPFFEHFNFENINYSLKKEDYEIFERNNESMAFVVCKPDDENEEIDYQFKSEFIFDRPEVITSLLLNDKRYVYVKKII